MILLINKQPVPPCRGCTTVASEHWAVKELTDVLGRDLLAADSIEFQEETSDDRD